jgi:glycosyltransferase involved in cell wall biosynthesis
MAKVRKVVVAASFDVFGRGGAPKRARQLASLFDLAGYEARLVGFRGESSDSVDGLRSTVRLEVAGRVGGRGSQRFWSLFGKGTGVGRAKGLLDRLESLLTEDGAATALVLYNQDPALARSCASIAARHRAAFVQQFAEFHQAKDYRLGVFSGYWIREQLHMRTVPRLASAYIAITSTLDALVRRNGGISGVVLPSIVDRGYWEKAFEQGALKRSRTQVLYVGEGARRDCLDIALQALARYRAQGGQCSLRCVGLRGYAKEGLRDGAKRLGLAHLVEAMGPISADELVREYLDAQAFLLLRSDDQSSRCCFPTRLGEMLIAAKPVVLSRVPDFSHYFEDGVSAVLTNPADAVSIAGGLSRATAAGINSMRIGEGGRDVARRVMSLEGNVEKVRSWLTQLPRE